MKKVTVSITFIILHSSGSTKKLFKKHTVWERPLGECLSVPRDLILEGYRWGVGSHNKLTKWTHTHFWKHATAWDAWMPSFPPNTKWMFEETRQVRSQDFQPSVFCHQNICPGPLIKGLKPFRICDLTPHAQLLCWKIDHIFKFKAEFKKGFNLWITGPGGIIWCKKTKSRKSHDTVPLKTHYWFMFNCATRRDICEVHSDNLCNSHNAVPLKWFVKVEKQLFEFYLSRMDTKSCFLANKSENWRALPCILFYTNVCKYHGLFFMLASPGYFALCKCNCWVHYF
jgi:hypothetical protein